MDFYDEGFVFKRRILRLLYDVQCRPQKSFEINKFKNFEISSVDLSFLHQISFLGFDISNFQFQWEGLKTCRKATQKSFLLA